MIALSRIVQRSRIACGARERARLVASVSCQLTPVLCLFPTTCCCYMHLLSPPGEIPRVPGSFGIFFASFHRARINRCKYGERLLHLKICHLVPDFGSWGVAEVCRGMATSNVFLIVCERWWQCVLSSRGYFAHMRGNARSSCYEAGLSCTQASCFEGGVR